MGLSRNCNGCDKFCVIDKSIHRKNDSERRLTYLLLILIIYFCIINNMLE